MGKYKDISLLTCNFNDSYMTLRMLESFLRLGLNDIKIYIMDNSTKYEISIVCKKYFTVINNTNFRYTKDYKQGSKNHCSAIDFALKNIIDTDYVLLVDNDILFKKNIVNLLNDYKKYDAIGEIGKDWVIPDRLKPYFCIINVKKMKEEQYNYFDENRCCFYVEPQYVTRINYENYNIIDTSNYLYDTGASFYEDIRGNWNIKNINLDDYIVHYRAGSNIAERNLCIKYNNIIYKYRNYEDFLNKNQNLLSINNTQGK